MNKRHTRNILTTDNVGDGWTDGKEDLVADGEDLVTDGKEDLVTDGDDADILD